MFDTCSILKWVWRENVYLPHICKQAVSSGSGTMMWWLSLMHNFIQQNLNSGSAQV